MYFALTNPIITMFNIKQGCTDELINSLKQSTQFNSQQQYNNIQKCIFSHTSILLI